MRSRPQLLITLLFLMSALFTLQGQTYVSAGGLRLGTEWGLTYKHRIANQITAEAILQSSFDEPVTRISLLGAKHFPLITKGFNIYGGGGLHAGWYERTPSQTIPHGGVSFIGGAEITLGRLNVSWDIKPALNIAGFREYKLLDMNSAVSLRYVFIKKTEKKTGNRKSSAGGKSKKTRKGKI
jgi:hypothetical protein